MRDINRIVKNREFLSADHVIYDNAAEDGFMAFIRDRGINCNGKFFGTPRFLERFEGFVSLAMNDTSIRLCLRPYLIAPMPDGIEAIYIDPKRYKPNKAGIIIDYDSFELKKFAFRTIKADY